MPEPYAPTAVLPAASAGDPAEKRTASTTRSDRFAGLDGLRALAVVLVMVYHLFPGVLPGGFIGVDVFFVISGFLITALLMRERSSTGRLDLRRFWVRRARRLVPAIVVLVLVCSTAALAVGGDVLVGLPRQILGAATCRSHCWAIAADASYFAQDAPELFRNLWSLGVEEQFYLVWPFVVLALVLVRPWWGRLIIVLGVAAASAVDMALLYSPGADPTRVYFGSDTHAFGLALGAALALLVARMKRVDLDTGETALQAFVRRWLPPLGAVSVLGLVVAAYGLRDDAAFTYQGGLVVVSVLAALAIWAAVAPGSSLGRLLDLAPLRAVGVRSYGLYLWHWPVFVLACALIPNEHDPLAAALIGVSALALSSLAAVVSYRWIEQPIRRHGVLGALRRARIRAAASRRSRRGGVGLLIVAVALVGTTVTAMVVAPAATSAERYIQQGRASVEQGQGRAADAAAATRMPVPLDPRPVATGRQLTALGDSVMLASAPSLQATFPGIEVDAVVSRQMRAAPDLVAAARESGSLRSTLVLGLGTNGPISADTLDHVLAELGPSRRLVLVDVQAPRPWADGVNATLHAFAAAHPQRVAVSEWRSTISGHLDLLADDQIHPGRRGGLLYASALHAALVELAEHSAAQPDRPWYKQP